MEQKYLPIGSVCTLKAKNKKVMITGYYSVEFNGNLKINDYMGCAYPEGMLLPEHNCTFNHSDIEKIEFIGFKNEEQKTFANLLNRLTGNVKSDEESAAEFHKKNDMFLTSNSTYSKLLFDENGVVMIADPVEEPKVEKENTLNNIKFDENGYVISVGNEEDVSNPFHKEYESIEQKNDSNNDWKIFNKIEFDENGTVVSAESDINDKKEEMLNKIEFDENGTVISVKGEDLEEKQNFEQYRFDENGTLIAIGNDTIEEDVPPIGPGLPGYVGPKNEETNYKFDENGVLIAVGEQQMEEDVPPLGPGLSGYVAPVEETASVSPTSNDFQFDANGNVIAAPQSEIEQASTISSNIQFDENGIVVSA